MSRPGGTIEPEHLSPDLAAPAHATGSNGSAAGSGHVRAGNLPEAIERVERDMITAALDQASGNISESARILGLTRRGLYLKLRRLGLESVGADL